ncbi:amino acid ABC transporter permease [Sporanaerobium hydrogeniformans]|uniref:Amino acid ABC transporter permease n=1 Tax=Sporanaerobium hydrogeniformans TaxID=3072179 RepID=A0AC61DEK1_9FIRM|nr:amino acid ABC transporter permease [Sporanaerobium hydrogeniformans]PHV71233.1 amino acid ABC transporter permease [Sporanaerobium hydrogeniformans]
MQEMLAAFLGEQTVAFFRAFMEQKFYNLLIQGMLWTLGLTAIATLIGILIGIVVAIIQICQFPKRPGVLGFILKWVEKILKFIAKLYVDVIRGTPVVVQIIFMWSVMFGQSSIPRIVVGGIAFGVNSGAYMSEIIRAGIMGIDKGQMEAGRSLGLKYIDTMRYIIMPQAFRQMLPTIVSEFVVLIKETAIVSFIGGLDLMKAGNIIISRTMNASLPLIIVALCYLLMTGIFTKIMRSVEKKLNSSR